MEGSFSASMRQFAENIVSAKQARLQEHRRLMGDLGQATQHRREEVRRLLADMRADHVRQSAKQTEARKVAVSEIRARTHSLLDLTRLGIRTRRDDIRRMADDVRGGLEAFRGAWRTGARTAPSEPAWAPAWTPPADLGAEETSGAPHKKRR